MGEQGSASLRRPGKVCAPSGTALHFWLTASKTFCPLYRQTVLGPWHPPIMRYLPFSSGPFHPPLPSTTALCNPLSLFLLVCTTHLERYRSFLGRKPATRVQSRFTLLFCEMLYSSFATAVIHHANTAKDCQITPQLLHSTAQGTRRAETNFF